MLRLGNRIKVLKAPGEAPHLLGQTGVVVWKHGKAYKVRIRERYTDFQEKDIALVR